MPVFQQVKILKNIDILEPIPINLTFYDFATTNKYKALKININY